MEKNRDVSKYKEIIVGDDYEIEIISGNLNELNQGLLTLKESIGTRIYNINFGKSTDCIDISKRGNNNTIKKVGLYLVLESSKVADVQKRAYGLANHLDLKHYMAISENHIINIITHHPLEVSVIENNREVDRWSIG